MDPAYYTLGTLLAVGVAYGLLARNKIPRQPKTQDRTGLALVIFVVAGFVISAICGSTNLVWLFGVLLMILIPALLITSIGSAIGSSLRGKKKRDE